MFNKGDAMDTVRGRIKIIATKTDPHIVEGIHPHVGDGGELFPKSGKDYVVAIPQNKDNEFDFIYEDLTELEVKKLSISK